MASTPRASRGSPDGRNQTAPGHPGPLRWRVGLLLVAAVGGAAPLPPALVERYYSAGVFPLIQHALTRASNFVPFALFDVLLVGSAGALMLCCARDLRAGQSWVRRLLRVSFRLATTAALFYVMFLFAWGLNYRRVPLREKLPYSADRITEDAAVALGRETVAELNRLHAPAHAEGWPGAEAIDPELARAFRVPLRETGARVLLPARPKWTVLDPYFRRAGVSGMTDPFFLETLVTSTLLPFERPFVVAHEWSHLAGFSDEGEANFVGWLTCLRGGPTHQYSGWLFLYAEVMNSLPRETARAVSRELERGPRDDLDAVRARLAGEVSEPLSAAGWQIYDQYLRANRVPGGTASYADVVTLVLGTQLR